MVIETESDRKYNIIYIRGSYIYIRMHIKSIPVADNNNSRKYDYYLLEEASSI